MKYEQAVALSDSLADLPDIQKHEVIFPNVVALQALTNLNNHNNSRALDLYKYLQTLDYTFTAGEYNNLGTVYLNLGMIDKARVCNDSVEALDPTDTTLEFAIACQTKDTDKIFDLIDNNFDYTNAEFESVYKRDYAKVIDDYYKSTIEKRQDELQSNRRHFMQFIIFMVLLVLLILMAVYALVKRKEARMNEKLILVDELSDTLRSQSDDISRLRGELAEGSTLQDTYKNKAKDQLLSKIQAFNEVCDVYSDSTGDTRQLVRRIEAFINKNATPKDLEEIEANINEYYEDIIERFRSDFPTLKDADVALFTLIVAGFKAPAIALYLKTDISTIYSRKYKLKQKMLKVDSTKASYYGHFL